MSINHGPRLMYALEVVYSCINDLQRLDSHNPFSGLDNHERRWQLKEFCTPLIHAIQRETDHFQQIDL